MDVNSPWRTTPRRTVVIFLLAVFCVFTVLGFANDIMHMGREPQARLLLSVVLTGVFASLYALTGITLRGRFWKAFLPLFAVQFGLNALLANRFLDLPGQGPSGGAEYFRARLSFDALATTIAVCLGYAGFAYVSISEGKRYGRTRADMALLESEMTAARHIQEVILPNPDQSFPGYAVESVYRSARQVGGDFFQILPDRDDNLLVVFGDVAGKGLPAAMLVSMLVGSIRTVAEYTREPATVLAKLHERLEGRTSAGVCTALAARICGDGTVVISNAGQLSPYLDGAEVELPGALPLGISGGGDYPSVQLALRPGSRLTFLSDGVVEAQNQKGELFGFDRTRSISTASAQAIAQAAVDFGQCDDITVLTVERLRHVPFAAQVHDEIQVPAGLG